METCYAHPGDLERLIRERFPTDANPDAVILWLGEHFRAEANGNIVAATEAGRCVFASPEGCTACLGGCGGVPPARRNEEYQRLHDVLVFAKLF